MPALQLELVLAQNAAGYSHPRSVRSFLLARRCLCHPSSGWCPQGGVPRPLGHAWVCLGSRAGWGCAPCPQCLLCPQQCPAQPSHHQWHPSVPNNHPGFVFAALAQGQGGTGDSYPCTQHPQEVSLLMDAKLPQISWHHHLHHPIAGEGTVGLRGSSKTNPSTLSKPQGPTGEDLLLGRQRSPLCCNLQAGTHCCFFFLVAGSGN